MSRLLYVCHLTNRKSGVLEVQWCEAKEGGKRRVREVLRVLVVCWVVALGGGGSWSGCRGRAVVGLVVG